MSELLRLQAEIERQDRELEVCFEQLRQLDPSTELRVSPEWMSEFASPVALPETAPPRGIRG